MAELNGQIGELKMTVQITRKETGETETVDLIGKVMDEKLKESEDGGNAQHGSA